MKILITASEGGHTARAVAIGEKYPQHKLAFITRKTDPWKQNLQELGKVYHMTKPVRLGEKPYKPHRWLNSFIQAIQILKKEQPDTIIGSGSNYMIPPILASKSLNKKPKIIATESFVEIGKPSKALKAIAKHTDEIWVQWKEQLNYFPNTKYVGLIIPKKGESGLKNGDTTYPSMKLMKAIQEGKRVKATIRKDVDHAKQKRFIEHMKKKRYLDKKGWTTP